MKSNYLFGFFVACFFFFFYAFVGQGVAQDVESLKKAIAEADTEETRLLQEELRLKQKRNTELAERNKQLKKELNESDGLSLPAAANLQPPNSQSATIAPAIDTSNTANNNSSIATINRPAPRPLINNAGPIATSGSDKAPSALEKIEEPKCSSFPVLPANASDEQRKQLEERVKEFSIFRQQLCSIIEESKPIVNNGQVISPAGIRYARSSDELVRLIVAKTVVDTDSPKLLNARKFLLEAEKVRTDKQIGADSKSNGTTSIVSKGGIPALFAFAVENGAATSSVEGTTMTFRLNPAGLLQTATGSNYVELFEERRNTPFLDFLGKTSLGFSFDTKRGFETPTFTGSERQLSAFSVRYEFINQRSPRHSRFRRLWTNFVKDPGERFFERQNELFSQIYLDDRPGQRGFRIPELRASFDKVDTKLNDASDQIVALIKQKKEDEATDLMEKIFLEELDQLPISKIRASPAYARFIESIEADEEYVEARNDLFDEIAKGQVATFEYINFREPIKPDTHSLRFIWEKGLWKGVDFTINASLTFYNRKPINPDVQKIRDFDFSGQFDIPLRRTDLGILKDSVISFAGKYQRLNTDVVADNGMVTPGTKGDIAVGQIKWTIPIGDTGLKLPLSLTYANRTELIKEKEIRGNFGLTIDFDAILARFRSVGLSVFR